ncbi:tetratricopeptide repeat protein [Variovorax sp. YR216]|uniref:tetratricopeptide repeat protein n=1 Tax=Variovorax sp. YR216 TaxID=1882828 RepID=UPI00089D6B6B|nr:tetratricopeptide repeat protein [Variovorax sp. YR216]SEA39963.1 Tetratricopeptide (TPR) repeat [Variovorax sp. YR216]
MSPQQKSELANRALAHQREGRVDLAEAAWKTLRQADPGDARAPAMLGLIAASKGDIPGAIGLLGDSLQRDPGNVAMRFNLALLHRQAGDLESALAGFEHVLAQRPGETRVLPHKADALHALGRHEEAIQCFMQMRQIEPLGPDLLRRFGESLFETGRHEEARAAFAEALRAKPDSAELLMNLGVAELALLRHDDALATLEKARRLAPGRPEIEFNLANALCAVDRFDEGIPLYEHLLAQDPNDGQVRMNLANALRDVQRHPEAIPHYDRLLAQPDAPAGVRWNRALCLLGAGDFAHGWPAYEQRIEEERFGHARTFDAPRWTGTEPLQGKTLLIHAEQGFGDTLQFCRYVPLLASRGARIVFEVQRSLLGSLRSLKGVDVLAGRGDALPAYDFHCPLMSLPLALGLFDMPGLTSEVPYLQADPERVDHWRQSIASQPGPRIGIVWTGNPDHPENHKRSIALAPLRASLPVNASVWSLLLPETLKQADAGTEGPAVQCFDASDFVNTAAQIMALDLLITTDTSIAHLAGAIGAPAWLLLPYAADWRWFTSSTTTPWYPAFRVFRQPSPGDWGSVLSELRAALEAITP